MYSSFMRNDKYSDISELPRDFVQRKFRAGNFRAPLEFIRPFLQFNTIYLDRDREYTGVFEFRRRCSQLERLQSVRGGS